MNLTVQVTRTHVLSHHAPMTYNSCPRRGDVDPYYDPLLGALIVVSKFGKLHIYNLEFGFGFSSSLASAVISYTHGHSTTTMEFK